MTAVAIRNGIYWPFERRTFIDGTVGTIDATGEIVAMMGNLYIDERAASKTLDTSGSSAIWFNLASRTFVNIASILDIGIQGLTTGGPNAIPDGAYTVKKRMIGGTDTFGVGSNSKTPDSGSATLSHGQQIAVVWTFNNRAGSDAIGVQCAGLAPSAQPGVSIWPTTNAFASAAWNATGSGQAPLVVITFSDGTLGWIDGAPFVGVKNNTTWTDATNPDEIGMMFQVPFDYKIDALWTGMRSVDGTSDFTLVLYELAESAPNPLATVTVDAAIFGATGVASLATYNLASEISLTANTDYCVAVKATGAGNVRIENTTLSLAAHRAIFPGGTTLRSVIRNASTGAFGSASNTVMYPMGVRISEISGFGGGGGTQRVIGG